MTFEDFKTTRRDTERISISEQRYIPPEEKPSHGEDFVFTSGYVYRGNLIIEKTNHSINPEAIGDYYLILERDEYCTNDLAKLEVLLYDYALRGGFLDITRDEAEAEIDRLTLAAKRTDIELAQDILDVTGREVDPDSDDLLYHLTTQEVFFVLGALRLYAARLTQSNTQTQEQL